MRTSPKSSFAKHFSEWFSSSPVSGRQIEAHLGIPCGYVTRWKQGVLLPRPDIEMLQKLAHLLRVPGEEVIEEVMFAHAEKAGVLEYFRQGNYRSPVEVPEVLLPVVQTFLNEACENCAFLTNYSRLPPKKRAQVLAAMGELTECMVSTR